MGPPVLPLVVEKIKQEPEAEILWHIIRRVAKVEIRRAYVREESRFSFPDYPEAPLSENVYLYWWREGRFKTEELFDGLYSHWQTLKSEDKKAEAQKIYKAIVNLGLPVLPYLADKITEEPELMGAFLELTEAKLPQTATPADCIQWWEKNQPALALPPRSSVQKEAASQPTFSQ